MSDLDTIITINITASTLGVSRQGYGVPIILSPNASWTERIRYYSDITGVVADFASGTPEYLAAAAMFNQAPHPVIIGIARLAHKPTQSWTVTPVVANSTVYDLYMDLNQDGADEKYTYTSDGSATAAEIVAGLTTAMGSPSGVTLGGTSTLTITLGAAGGWRSLKVGNPALLSAVMDYADAGGSSGAANDLDAILNEDGTWYAVYNLFNSESMAAAISAWCETNKRFFLCDSQDTPIVSVVSGSDSTSIAAVVTANTRRYTAVMYKSNNIEMAGAAWLGARLPKTPGSENWAYAPLVGVTADVLTTSQILNAQTKRVSIYISKAGVPHTEFGTVGSTTYRYIDIVRLIDWMTSEMQADIFTDLVSNDKVPYDDDGIAIIKNRVRGVLMRGYLNKALQKPGPTDVTAPVFADIQTNNPSDITNRTLNNVNFRATSTGAINKVTVNGKLSF